MYLPSRLLRIAQHEKGLKHDCLPVSCGKPPSAKHASTLLEGQEVLFNSPPVEYTCDTGYTLDSLPDGDTTFTVECETEDMLQESSAQARKARIRGKMASAVTGSCKKE